LFNSARDANPFFHFYEALWMLAGRNDVAPLDYYLGGKYSLYSDDTVTANGAYGYRWRHARAYDHNPNGIVAGAGRYVTEHRLREVDQLAILIEHMKRKPENRRFVLQNWNVEDDLLKLDTSRDVCCNLSIVFAIREGTHLHDAPKFYLDITVFNRSNDTIWGMLGANVVHFSVLQEYMAGMLGIEVGRYFQVSNNVHVYESNWEPEKWLKPWAYYNHPPYPMMKGDLSKWDEDCYRFVDNAWGDNLTEMVETDQFLWRQKFINPFFYEVAIPIAEAFWRHKQRNYERAHQVISLCLADDWREACRDWLFRRQVNWEKKQGSEQ
jgi:thymidylate synthase